MALIEAGGNGAKWLAVMVIGVIMTIGGCLYGVKHQDEQTVREKEKTKQLEIQCELHLP